MTIYGIPARCSALASLTRRDSYIGVQCFCQPDVILNTLHNVFLFEVAESHCEFVKPVKNREPLLDREVFFVQESLFKPPDFVWVLDHRITEEVFVDVRYDENPRESKRIQNYFFGATVRIIRTMSSSSFRVPDCGRRGTRSIQFLSFAKISLKMGSDSWTLPTFTSATACQNFMESTINIVMLDGEVSIIHVGVRPVYGYKTAEIFQRLFAIFNA
jgi:hypothetical protein